MGRVVRSVRRSACWSGPACTCTTCAPAEQATRWPASVAMSISAPTTARRIPPPADEHAYSSGSAPDPAAETARTAASMPVRTSVAVVGCSANPARPPSGRTSTAFVHVEPTSRHTAA